MPVWGLDLLAAVPAAVTTMRRKRVGHSDYVRLEISRNGGPFQHQSAMPDTTIADQPGSLTVWEDDRRQILIFGWVEGQVGVFRSRGGYDTEMGELRVVFANEGLELVSDLAEPYEVDYALMPGSRVRFTLVRG